MESVRIAEKLTKEEARDAIALTIQRFNATFTYVQDNPRFHLYNESFIKVVHKLDNDNYYLKASQYLLGEDFKRLGAKGLTEFLLKLKVVSEKFGLHVAIPQNVKVIGEDVVQKFIENLTTSALIGINHNITELGDLKEDLIKQAEHIDLKKPVDRMTQLELCILKKKEYIDGCYQRPDLIQRQNGLLENGYVDEHNAIQAKLDAISQIPKDYPLIQFLTGTTDYSAVTNQIEKAVKTVSNAQTKIKNMILDGSFPVWELDQTVLAERNKITDSKELQTVDEWLKKCKTDKKIKDLLMTLVPIGLTLITFFIPGGASLLLLGMKAGAQVLNASFGVVSAVSDIKDGYIEIVKSNADIKLSKEQIDLLEAQGKDAAVFQFFAALISAGFVILDIKDAAKAISLYNKADNIGAAARARLRKCQKLGANQLQECSENGLRFIGKIENEENAVYILNMGNNVVDAIGKSSKKVLADNLSKLSVDQLPKAFNFFPNNLNTNIIWLSIVDKPADVISEVKYTEVFKELAKRAEILTNADSKAIEKYFSSVNKAFSQEELVIVAKIKDGMDLPEIGVRLQSGAYDGFCKNEDIQQVFFTKLDEIAGKAYDGGRSPVENLMKRLGFTDEDVAKNMKIFDNPDGRMYLDVVVSRDKGVFKSVNWDDVEDRFIKYVDSMDKRTKDFKLFRKKYNDIFDGNVINRKQLEELYFNAFKSKEATKSGFSALNELQTNFFNEVIYNKFNINEYYTGQGFTATIDEKVFGTGEMVLESTGKETLPLSNKNYITYRYSVDKECNIKLYNVYD